MTDTNTVNPALTDLQDWMPREDIWDDVPEDFRDEVYCDLPPAITYEDGTTDGIGDLNREAAERLVRRYHALAAEEREAVAFVDSEIAAHAAAIEALKLRREEIMTPIQRRRAWLDQYQPLLERYTRETLGGGKTRSIKLAYGTLKLRKNPARLDVIDESVAVEWARDNAPDAVKLTLSRTVAKRWITETGEVIPGCELVPGDEVFSVAIEGE